MTLSGSCACRHSLCESIRSLLCLENAIFSNEVAHHVAQAGFELMNFPPSPLECWDYRPTPPPFLSHSSISQVRNWPVTPVPALLCFLSLPEGKSSTSDFQADIYNPFALVFSSLSRSLSPPTGAAMLSFLISTLPVSHFLNLTLSCPQLPALSGDSQAVSLELKVTQQKPTVSMWLPDQKWSSRWSRSSWWPGRQLLDWQPSLGHLKAILQGALPSPSNDKSQVVNGVRERASDCLFCESRTI